jgi:hypothetical protein
VSQAKDAAMIRGMMSIIDKEGMTAIQCLARFFNSHENQLKEFILRAVENYDTKPYLLDNVSSLA